MSERVKLSFVDRERLDALHESVDANTAVLREIRDLLAASAVFSAPAAEEIAAVEIPVKGDASPDEVTPVNVGGLRVDFLYKDETFHIGDRVVVNLDCGLTLKTDRRSGVIEGWVMSDDGELINVLLDDQEYPLPFKPFRITKEAA